MAQTDEQARQIAERAQQFHAAIHQASTPDQIREVCQAAAADYAARNGEPAREVTW
ncbi:cytosine/adenosine deaminase-related metal-dependent hydrolase [Kitasatospora herbaricolor]|uniref:hypothetical protein n=1 Tax=Kitasatospora herbaricolor TaxID=68217 RepID=UPI00174E6CBA|nr:hypothetical protein [Kitasatospora herbaricolor]MDQ0305481.1 cytosine/adenosine deaminase-related metal-dependent hydrolase [Kitasatospora herbaricolor]